MKNKKLNIFQKINAKSNEIIKWMWLSALGSLIIAAGIFVFIAATQMPDTQELENPRIEESSQVYSADGEVFGRYYIKNREIVSFDDLNPYLVDALVATEDERYYNHSGIDMWSFARAVAFLGRDGGGSTITQQLAKQFFVKKSRSTIKRLWQKLKEWTIAVEFERRYTKEEIIAMYLNKSEFPYNSFGVGAASRTYFDKDQKDLTQDEAAVLIAMLKSPYRYNPRRFPERSKARRNIVLGQMLKNQYINKSEYDELTALELDVTSFKETLHYKGIAPYFRKELTKWLKDLLKQDAFLKSDGTKYDIYGDGLKIYTTIDSRMQAHAEAAMKEHMEQLQKNFFNHWEDEDPWTYDTDKKTRAIRKNKFNYSIRTSERYQSLKKKYLSAIIEEISSDLETSNWGTLDIITMMKEQSTPGTLAKKVKNRSLAKNTSKMYKSIMNHERWPELEKQWKLMEKASKKEFSTKRKMKVFAYNAKGEKEVNMSPIDSVRYHQMHMQLGSMSVEPSTGHIKTWVGGIDNKYFQFDHVNDRGQRQVGSTFKPFLYATAISQLAMSPCLRVADIPCSIPAGDSDWGLRDAWLPNNSDGKHTGLEITLKEGLAKSKNSISCWLIKQLRSVDNIKEICGNMGIKSERIASGPAAALGASNLSVFEMTGAYTTFANNGVYTEPIFVTRIEDNRGKVIYNASASQESALDESTNYAMVDMLQNNEHLRAAKLNTTFGGKTGTTNNFTDGWFMGITPELVVGTWVGGDNSWIRFRTSPLGYGSQMARPFFFEFMKRVERDKSLDWNSDVSFYTPEELEVTVDCGVYDSLFYNAPVDQEPIEEEPDDEFEEEF